jgi:succinoglycan biosynthesis protein ExoV
LKIIFYKDPIGNFGDDLNELIWPRILPLDVRDAPDVVLVGIGSLLDQARFRGVQVEGKQVFVLGSGAAYGALPIGCERWNYLAVRGPLTAAVIDQPRAAVTDSAALLARLPELVPSRDVKKLVLFIPHHRTLVNSRWKEAAELAGMTYVDPQWNPERILSLFGQAKLVITEAMHGAIVADSLRIPWIPVVISPEISIFKWRDWTSSLELPYKPLSLPPTTHLEALRYGRIRKLTISSGRTVAESQAALRTDTELLSDFHSRFRHEPQVIDSVPAPGYFKVIVKRVLGTLDGPRVNAAAAALLAASKTSSYLSHDLIFSDRLNRLEEAKSQLIHLVRAGQWR